jgi:uncharacterized membrane protein YhiD involved in acid resistance
VKSSWSSRGAWLALLALALVVALLPWAVPRAYAQPPPPSPSPQGSALDGGAGHTPESQLDYLQDAAISLPVAAALGALLAFRPRRRGTPDRSAPVIQTQIILAVVGAVVMMIVGASLARAFGIVGVASLIRYRAKIDDPKDAGVMLATLGVGLASGVGLYSLAAFATVFFLLVLWVVESFEPEATRTFTLVVKGQRATVLRPKIEQLLRRYRLGYTLHTSAEEEVAYEVEAPLERSVNRVPDAILQLDEQQAISVEWEEKVKKKKAG